LWSKNILFNIKTLFLNHQKQTFLIMQVFNVIQTVERINQLIRLKATGSPSELADKLGLEERQVYRIIADLKDSGLPILYCKKRKTYYYATDVFMKFEISVVDGDEKRKIIGGENQNSNFNNIFFQTDILCQFEHSSLFQVEG
jgi:biotin operon repressor